MAAIVRIITVISAVFLFAIKVNVTAKDTLRLGVLIPVKGVLDLSAYIPTMELALETVANDTTLPFNFSIIRNDSMVSSYVRNYMRNDTVHSLRRSLTGYGEGRVAILQNQSNHQ